MSYPNPNNFISPSRERLNNWELRIEKFFYVLPAWEDLIFMLGTNTSRPETINEDLLNDELDFEHQPDLENEYSPEIENQSLDYLESDGSREDSLAAIIEHYGQGDWQKEWNSDEAGETYYFNREEEVMESVDASGNRENLTKKIEGSGYEAQHKEILDGWKNSVKIQFVEYITKEGDQEVLHVTAISLGPNDEVYSETWKRELNGKNIRDQTEQGGDYRRESADKEIDKEQFLNFIEDNETDSQSETNELFDLNREEVGLELERLEDEDFDSEPYKIITEDVGVSEEFREAVVENGVQNDFTLHLDETLQGTEFTSEFETNKEQTLEPREGGIFLEPIVDNSFGNSEKGIKLETADVGNNLDQRIDFEPASKVENLNYQPDEQSDEQIIDDQRNLESIVDLKPESKSKGARQEEVRRARSDIESEQDEFLKPEIVGITLEPTTYETSFAKEIKSIEDTFPIERKVELTTTEVNPTEFSEEESIAESTTLKTLSLNFRELRTGEISKSETGSIEATETIQTEKETTENDITFESDPEQLSKAEVDKIEEEDTDNRMDQQIVSQEMQNGITLKIETAERKITEGKIDSGFERVKDKDSISDLIKREDNLEQGNAIATTRDNKNSSPEAINTSKGLTVETHIETKFLKHERGNSPMEEIEESDEKAIGMIGEKNLDNQKIDKPITIKFSEFNREEISKDKSTTNERGENVALKKDILAKDIKIPKIAREAVEEDIIPEVNLEGEGSSKTETSKVETVELEERIGENFLMNRDFPRRSQNHLAIGNSVISPSYLSVEKPFETKGDELNINKETDQETTLKELQTDDVALRIVRLANREVEQNVADKEVFNITPNSQTSDSTSIDDEEFKEFDFVKDSGISLIERAA